ncbi:hypothetical protein FHL15_008712 [Xylaria flabelliformis]|uniref:SH3 domain-containing protein n=1 Tax=Xylaria flabelliformis TaxID=2512241 RepID=A0A553HQW7_9PEZI|nr:hypothetical protein FHL15_008712 [Xylaria flabelliformis]
MTRPQIIRADSIDLQDHDAPSAQDHTHPTAKSTSSANTNGSLAPHQAETIREVEEERAEEESRSPRVSWANGGGGSGDNNRDLQLYAEELASGIVNSLNGNKMQQQDALAIAQNGGVVGHTDDDGDAVVDTDDDDLDDDMMDKISSSPSIEDGGCTLPSLWPARSDSLRNSLSSHDFSSSPVVTETRSSSPYIELPEHFPHLSYQQSSKASVDAPNLDLLPGGYTTTKERDNDDIPDAEMQLALEMTVQDCDLGKVLLESSENLREQSYLAQDRDSGIDLKIEDFSLNRPASAEEEPAEDEMISPYEFLIPYVASDDDGDEEAEDDFSFTDDSRFIDSGWGGECLQDAEDIDFQFVYALHTFVATVEGQANATKGDTMVLLDDSNSYWWLVRVVKDSSIGYLPAEHIETPTERLARLNKHRNIDAEKARNPIMTAMKRRKAKTVAFAAPTYVDYSDIEYSDEEAEEDDTEASQQAVQQEDQQKQATAQQGTTDVLEDESAKVEPLKPRGQKQGRTDTAKSEDADNIELSAKESTLRSSDEFFDGKTERTTRNGTVRNTDSFFRDESIETKKITLTPGLLRDDNEPRASNESKDLRQRPSLEKDLVPDKIRDDRKKKEKGGKEKDKKPSAIRSFFSRKDKKKSLDDDDESFGKRSMDAGTGFGDAEMVDEPEEMDSSPQQKSPQRNPSKLQKQQPRLEPSPTRKPAAADSDRHPHMAAETKTNNVANVPPVTVRMVESEQPENQEMQARRDEKNKTGVSKILPVNAEPNPPKTTVARSRMELDDFDSSTDEEDVLPEPTRAPPPEPKRESSEDKSLRPSLPGSFPDSSASVPQQNEAAGTRSPTERLSESPVQVSPITSHPPALMGDDSSQEDRSSSVSSPSPELADAENSTHRNQDSMTTSASPTTTQTWNDANLRAFFDSGSEIRDLLVVVYDDKTDATPVASNHPIANSLFREQNAKLAEITTQLDNMLGDWLARKQRLRA